MELELQKYADEQGHVDTYELLKVVAGDYADIIYGILGDNVWGRTAKGIRRHVKVPAEVAEKLQAIGEEVFKYNLENFVKKGILTKTVLMQAGILHRDNERKAGIDTDIKALLYIAGAEKLTPELLTQYYNTVLTMFFPDVATKTAAVVLKNICPKKLYESGGEIAGVYGVGAECQLVMRRATILLKTLRKAIHSR